MKEDRGCGKKGCKGGLDSAKTEQVLQHLLNDKRAVVVANLDAFRNYFSLCIAGRPDEVRLLHSFVHGLDSQLPNDLLSRRLMQRARQREEQSVQPHLIDMFSAVGSTPSTIILQPRRTSLVA